jgi:FlaG/FlaF family flagellin (archaellin)
MSNEFMNRVGRPMQNASQGGATAPAPQSGGKQKKGLNLAKVGTVILVALVTILLVSVIVGLAFGQKGTISSEIQGDKYQAVFLNSSDGQVYFGKLTVLNKDYYKLEDIYYVRVQQVQPDKNTAAQQNISLAKLGSEIHGPQDVMYIRSEHVMFWENLKDDGQVVKAITEYKKTGSTTGGATTPAAGTTPSTNTGTGTGTTR